MLRVEIAGDEVGEDGTEGQTSDSSEYFFHSVWKQMAENNVKRLTLYTTRLPLNKLHG